MLMMMFMLPLLQMPLNQPPCRRHLLQHPVLSALNQEKVSLIQLFATLMAHSCRLGLVTWRYQVLIPVGPGICH